MVCQCYVEIWLVLVIVQQVSQNEIYTFNMLTVHKLIFYDSIWTDFTCLRIGENPNHGYTNFDNFMWSMLTTFQLITLDYWENVYNMVGFEQPACELLTIMVFLFCIL